MMKNLALELHNEPENMEKLEIQGLYHSENCCQSFWTLKTKIELAIFQEHKKEVKNINE